MLILTNPAAQVVQPGQAVVFTRADKTGKCCAGIGPSGTSAKLGKGSHLISFGANVGGAAGTQANLAIALGGEAVPYTTMTATITAAADVYSVSRTVPVRECCCDFDRVSVINTGTTPVNVAANPMLAITKGGCDA